MTAAAREPGGGAEEPGDNVGDRLNATVIELGPGQNAGPYRFEYANEELLLVIAGRPTVRDPDGEQALEPGDLVCFSRGPAGAHEIRNDGDRPARLLVLATQHRPQITAYPDHGTLRVTPPGLRFRVADAI